MMNHYEKKMLKELIKKYESSKTFNGSNAVTQNFYLSIEKIFPKYEDDSEYELYKEVNDAIDRLSRLGFIVISKRKNDFIQQVKLETRLLDIIYKELGMKSKKVEHLELIDMLTPLLQQNNLVSNYAKEQLMRIQENKTVAFYSGDVEELHNIIKGAIYLIGNEKEQYIREASIQLYGDSKELEHLKSKIQGLLFQYGSYEDKEFVMEECGVVNTPTYVTMKGNAILKFENEMIDLNKLGGDIALSTNTLSQLKSIQIKGDKVITIENLTTFHNYEEKDDFLIYLGGFHNKVKRDLLIDLYKQNSEKKYYHFGDIDLGGFYIYKHLVNRTKIPFVPYKMDIQTLEINKLYWKNLTQNDRKRIDSILDVVKTNEFSEEIMQTILFMRENNCKLEQEAIEYYE